MKKFNKVFIEKDNMKEEFIRLLRSTNREGMEDVINFLEKLNFVPF